MGAGALGPMLYAAQIGAFGRRGASQRSITCKYCGKHGLEWKQTMNGWRLYEGHEKHMCRRDAPPFIPTWFKE